MSRFAIDPPDDDKYEGRPHPDDVSDIDVPDFDQPDEPSCVACEVEDASGSDYGRTHTCKIDPAEHAAHALIDALTTLEQQIALCPQTDLERARMLYGMVFRHEKHVAVVTDKASAKVDEILERRR